MPLQLFHYGLFFILIFQLMVIGFQAINIRRKEYFYYICYILFVLIYNLRIIFPVWPDFIPEITKALTDRPVVILMQWSYFQFIRYFLDVPKLIDFDKKINRIANYLLLVFAFDFSFTFIPSWTKFEQLFFNIQFILCTAVFVYIFVKFLMQRKNELNNFMIPAVIMVLIGGSSSFILYELNKKFNLQLSEDFMILPHQIMSILELALFTSGVSMKAYLIEKEKRKTETQLWAQQQASHLLSMEIHELKTAFASDLHDDVGASLSSIDIYSNMGIQALKNTNLQQAEESLESINHVVHQSLANMRDTLWLLDKSPNTLGSCYTRWLDFAAPLLSISKINLHLQWNVALQEIPIGIQAKRDIFLTLKEATNNIIRHANAENVCFISSQNGKNISIELNDDGNGFDVENSIQNGNGIFHMLQREKNNHLRVRVISNPTSGTSIKIEFSYD